MWKISSQCLSIHKIDITAPIGVYDFEKKQGNRFLVSVDVWGDFNAASISDNMADTLDYQLIETIVIEELTKPSDLIEHVAYEIMKRIQEIPFDLSRIRVYIQKMNPPLQSKVADTSFELIMDNEE